VVDEKKEELCEKTVANLGIEFLDAIICVDLFMIVKFTGIWTFHPKS